MERLAIAGGRGHARPRDWAQRGRAPRGVRGGLRWVRTVGNASGAWLVVDAVLQRRDQLCGRQSVSSGQFGVRGELLLLRRSRAGAGQHRFTRLRSNERLLGRYLQLGSPVRKANGGFVHGLVRVLPRRLQRRLLRVCPPRRSVLGRNESMLQRSVRTGGHPGRLRSISDRPALQQRLGMRQWGVRSSR